MPAAKALPQRFVRPDGVQYHSVSFLSQQAIDSSVAPLHLTSSRLGERVPDVPARTKPTTGASRPQTDAAGFLPEKLGHVSQRDPLSTSDVVTFASEAVAYGCGVYGRAEGTHVSQGGCNLGSGQT